MKKILSLVLVVCMIMSAFGTVTAFGATASGGAGGGGSPSGGGGGSVVVPSAPSGGGGGGSSSGGGGGGAYQAAYWELYSNGVVCNNGAYYPGDLVIDGCVTTISGSYDVFVIIAQYDDRGTLIRNDIRRKTVSVADTCFYAELNDVDVNGIVKCMIIRADNLKPITPSKSYVPFGRSLVIDISQIASASIGGATDSIVEYYASNESVRTDKIYVSAYPTITVNGVQVPNNNQFDLLNYMYYMAQVRFVETNGDNYFDCVAVTVYEYGIVEEVLPDRDRINFIDGYKVTYDSSDPYQIVNIYDKSGKAISLDDINPGDVLAMIVGELDYSGSYCPVRALNFSEKLTIYNLGNNKITGVITGFNPDYEVLYIDGVEYQYSSLPWITTNDLYDLMAGDLFGIKADFYLDMTGKIIGYDGSAYVKYNIGFIVDAYKNTQGFEPHWQIKLLTKDEGIVIYNVDTRCDIDSITCDLSYNTNAQDALNVGKYYNAAGLDVNNRVIDFELNKNGEIDEIKFVASGFNTRTYSLNGNYDEYRETVNKLGSKIVADNIMIFNVNTSDIHDANVRGLSSLIDGGLYGGTMYDLDNDKQFDIFVMQDGTLASTDEEPGETPEEEPVVPDETQSDGYGFIIDTYFNTAAFEPQWQLKVLTENHGTVVYNVKSKCEINGTLCDLSRTMTSQDVLALGKYYNGSGDPNARIVEYEVDNNGEIDKICFANNIASGALCYYMDYDEYNSDERKLGSKLLDEDIVVFDVNYFETTDINGLYNKACYEGIVVDFDNDADMDVFVATACVLSFDAEASLLVVDSVMKTTYGEDNEDAYQVKYYTDGKNELKSVYFTEDSINVLSNKDDFKDLSKGALFTAIINNDNLATHYAVVATTSYYHGGYELNGDLKSLTQDIYGSNEVGNVKGDKTEFIYGYISKISGKVLTIGGTAYSDFCDGRDFVIDSNVAQYCYNLNSSRPLIDVGDYRSTGVDIFDEFSGSANPVFLKVYDDEVTDIISFTRRESTSDPGIIAQTHYTGPGLDLN